MGRAGYILLILLFAAGAPAFGLTGGKHSATAGMQDEDRVSNNDDIDAPDSEEGQEAALEDIFSSEESSDATANTDQAEEKSEKVTEIGKSLLENEEVSKAELATLAKELEKVDGEQLDEPSKKVYDELKRILEEKTEKSENTIADSIGKPAKESSWSEYLKTAYEGAFENLGSLYSALAGKPKADGNATPPTSLGADSSNLAKQETPGKDRTWAEWADQTFLKPNPDRTWSEWASQAFPSSNPDRSWSDYAKTVATNNPDRSWSEWSNEAFGKSVPTSQERFSSNGSEGSRLGAGNLFQNESGSSGSPSELPTNSIDSPAIAHHVGSGEIESPPVTAPAAQSAPRAVFEPTPAALAPDTAADSARPTSTSSASPSPTSSVSFAAARLGGSALGQAPHEFKAPESAVQRRSAVVSSEIPQSSQPVTEGNVRANTGQSESLSGSRQGAVPKATDNERAVTSTASFFTASPLTPQSPVDSASVPVSKPGSQSAASSEPVALAPQPTSSEAKTRLTVYNEAPTTKTGGTTVSNIDPISPPSTSEGALSGEPVVTANPSFTSDSPKTQWSETTQQPEGNLVLDSTPALAAVTPSQVSEAWDRVVEIAAPRLEAVGLPGVPGAVRKVEETLILGEIKPVNLNNGVYVGSDPLLNLVKASQVKGQPKPMKPTPPTDSIVINPARTPATSGDKFNAILKGERPT